MKKVRTTTRMATLAAFGFSALLITSCNSDKPEDPKDVAEEQNDDRFEERRTEKDADFLVEAATINMEEIKLGELAQERGTMKDVKDLGKMMVKEHTAALNDLKALAESKSVSLPAALPDEAQDAYDKLNEKAGVEFDKEYCDKMVKGHEKAIDRFEKEASDSEDSEIRTWASSMLPSLKMHLEHSKACQAKCEAAKDAAKK